MASVRSKVPPPVVPRPVPAAAAPERRADSAPTDARERRQPRGERRRADRRAHDAGSPYGVERRSGHDDRLADRRGGAERPAGIGLMRDYFAPPDERETPASAMVPAADIVRFHD